MIESHLVLIYSKKDVRKAWKESPMSIQSDRWIRKQTDQRRIIESFSEKQLAAGLLCREVSSYGYGMRSTAEPGGAG
jgi:hypothetical protein